MKVNFVVIGKKIVKFSIKCFIFFVTFLEFTLFLIKNKQILKKRVVYPFWNQSFGHQIMGFDWASRLYFPRKVAIVHLLHPRNNSRLNLCFSNLEYYRFESSFFGRTKQAHYWGLYAYQCVRCYLLIVSSVIKTLTVISQFNLYKTLSTSTERLFIGDEDGEALAPYADTTGYMRLIRESIGEKPKLAGRESEKVLEELIRVIPNFSADRLICLILRNKGSWRNTDRVRTSSDQTNYIPGIAWLCKRNYFVFCLGESSSKVFSNIKNVYFTSDFNIDYELLNLFCLTNAAGLICNQSGPYLLAESAGVPCLIIDNIWPSYGSWSDKSLIVNKKIAIHASVLSDETIYESRPDVAFGLNSDNLNIIGLSRLQILKSIIIFIRGFSFRVRKYKYPRGSRIKSSNNPVILV